MNDDAQPDRQSDAAPGRSAAMAVVAAALAAGATVKAAAARGQVGERTVYTWLRTRPKFRAAVQRVRDRLVSQAVGRLSKSMSAAADVLRKLLKSADENTQLKASRAILELALRAREADELRRRIEELERKLETKQ